MLTRLQNLAMNIKRYGTWAKTRDETDFCRERSCHISKYLAMNNKNINARGQRLVMKLTFITRDHATSTTLVMNINAPALTTLTFVAANPNIQYLLR